MGDDYVAFGTFHYGAPEYPDDWVDGAPASPEDQSCAFCDAQDVTWVHPLDADKVEYRAWGKGYTLPSFWALCERCEQLYQAGADEDIVTVMSAAQANWTDDIDEAIRHLTSLGAKADISAAAERFACVAAR
ncbi:hypothetical protein [Flexivirga caeni]|uniref:Uncharacterized protein n=1 Tax=Flexivirga caeni TaxID=2294115 RepID=A0A3M9MHU1_9MICO|nr:hypothetical protein [Flexivirga caeni]RNI25140.1 hypothetical protein EFY87_00350 [Flexivirga caeni]